MRELAPADVAELQRFEQNPEYFFSVNGEGPRIDEAQQELDDLPPAGMPFTRRWLLGFVDADDALVAMATVLADFLAAEVWHLGLFVVRSALHGSGVAPSIYAELEGWMRADGASAGSASASSRAMPRRSASGPRSATANCASAGLS